MNRHKNATELFFVEPGDEILRQALMMSDHLSSEPEKQVKMRDGVHNLLQCESKKSAEFIFATQERRPEFRICFWKQVGSSLPRRCHLKLPKFDEIGNYGKEIVHHSRE